MKTFIQSTDNYMIANVRDSTYKSSYFSTYFDNIDIIYLVVFLNYLKRVLTPKCAIPINSHTSSSSKAQGTSQKRRQKESKSQRMWRDAVRCCLLNMTWLSHSWTHKRWGYWSKTSHKIKPSKVLVYGGSVLQALAFTKELLRVDSYWRRIMLFKGCGHWQIPHVAVDDSMPVHVWGALI